MGDACVANKVTVICAILFQSWSCYPGFLWKSTGIFLPWANRACLFGICTPKADKQSKMKHEEHNLILFYLTSQHDLDRSAARSWFLMVPRNNMYCFFSWQGDCNWNVKRLFSSKKTRSLPNPRQARHGFLLEETRSFKLISKNASTPTCYTFPVMAKLRLWLSRAHKSIGVLMLQSLREVKLKGLVLLTNVHFSTAASSPALQLFYGTETNCWHLLPQHIPETKRHQKGEKNIFKKGGNLDPPYCQMSVAQEKGVKTDDCSVSRSSRCSFTANAIHVPRLYDGMSNQKIVPLLHFIRVNKPFNFDIIGPFN